MNELWHINNAYGNDTIPGEWMQVDLYYDMGVEEVRRGRTDTRSI